MAGIPLAGAPPVVVGSGRDPWLKAKLTGGEFFHFHDARDLKQGLIAVSNDVPNYCVLSFRPTSLTAGIHALHVEIRNRRDVVLRSRAEYWIESDTAR
jgi:hypothetical protein